jgi:hypothetical protein
VESGNEQTDYRVTTTIGGHTSRATCTLKTAISIVKVSGGGTDNPRKQHGRQGASAALSCYAVMIDQRCLELLRILSSIHPSNPDISMICREVEVSGLVSGYGDWFRASGATISCSGSRDAFNFVRSGGGLISLRCLPDEKMEHHLSKQKKKFKREIEQILLPARDAAFCAIYSMESDPYCCNVLIWRDQEGPVTRVQRSNENHHAVCSWTGGAARLAHWRMWAGRRSAWLCWQRSGRFVETILRCLGKKGRQPLIHLS